MSRLNPTETEFQKFWDLVEKKKQKKRDLFCEQLEASFQDKKKHD